MAGDWIKFEIASIEKLEVFKIARDLEMEPDAVLGKLMRVWSWFNVHTEDGVADVSALLLLDQKAGRAGFCESMQKAGWLDINDNTLQLPNFERHNGSSAKKRILDAARKGARRSQKSCPQNVHEMSVSKPDKKRIREEKSRVENSGEENTKESVASPESSADASRPPSDVFLLFPTNKKGQGVQIYESDVERWQMLYQTVDVRAEVRKCLAWNEANPKRRKTAGGLHKHINGWLSKVHDNGGTPYHKPPDLAVQKRKQSNEEPSWYQQFMREEYDMEEPKSWASLGQIIQAEFTTIYQSRVKQAQPSLAPVQG